jgi:3-isopropylmalate/(R)-2-methylmalate dehydratase small subunit
VEQFSSISARALPLMRINIDTDQIIPTRFLLRVSEEGLGEGLFADWRLRPDGSLNPDFLLNQPDYACAKILLADRNFGCGSSREAAPRALRQAGFRAVIAPSFGDIFFSNCFRNGLLPVRLDIADVKRIADAVLSAHGRLEIHIDLARNRIEVDGFDALSFATPGGLRDMLLLGEDEIDQTSRHSAAIERFRSADRLRRPWAYQPG